MSANGSRTEVATLRRDVCFCPVSGHRQAVSACPKSAIRRLAQFAQVTRMPTGLVLACAGRVRPERVENLLILLDPFRGHWFGATGPC